MSVLVSVLLVEADAARAEEMRAALGGPFDLASATSEDQAFHMTKRRDFDTIVTAYRPPDINGAALLARVQELHRWLTGVVLVSHTDYSALQAQMGAVRCLALLTPLVPERLRELVTRSAHLNRMKQTTSAATKEAAGLPSRQSAKG